jgi:hypothetical protein
LGSASSHRTASNAARVPSSPAVRSSGKPGKIKMLHGIRKGRLARRGAAGGGRSWFSRIGRGRHPNGKRLVAEAPSRASPTFSPVQFVRGGMSRQGGGDVRPCPGPGTKKKPLVKRDDERQV